MKKAELGVLKQFMAWHSAELVMNNAKPNEDKSSRKMAPIRNTLSMVDWLTKLLIGFSLLKVKSLINFFKI